MSETGETGETGETRASRNPASRAIRHDTDPAVTIDQVVELTGLSTRTVYTKLERGEYRVQPTTEKAANGRPIIQILLASLPDVAQGHYRQQQPSPQPSALSPERPGLDWTGIAQPHQEKALRRYALVQRAQAIQAGPRGSQTAQLQALAKEAGISAGQLYAWLARFERDGVPGLLDQYARPRPRRYRKLTETIQDFIKQEFLAARQPSPTTVYDRLFEFCAHMKLPAPSAGTVMRFIRRAIPAAVADYHRRGPKYFEREHEYKCWRDVSDLPVGAWITGDHRVADVWVYATDAPDAKVIRPWYTCYGDIRSRLLDGVVVERPSSASIKLALRRWMLQHGVPRHHYCDNGKDYECHALNGRVVTFGKAGLPRGVKARLFLPGVLNAVGIQDHDALPKKPWGKPIESWFRHVFCEWEKSLPGWCGNDPKHKPESLERDLKEGRLLTLDEFARRAAEQIERWNQTAHDVLEGATPASLWQGITIERPRPETMNLLMLSEDRAKVRQNTIRAFGLHYYHEALYAYTGQWVSYRYDPSDLGQLVVMVNGTHVCDAVSDPAMRYGASQAAMRELMRKKKAGRLAAQAWPEHQRVLYRPEEILAEVSKQIREKKVYRLHRDPAPRPGTKVATRMLPGLDQAAASVARASRTRQGRQPERPPMAPAPASLNLEELLVSAPPPRPAPEEEHDRDAILNALIND